jgi:hypothetical protein
VLLIAIAFGLGSRLGPGAVVRALGAVQTGDICYAVAAFAALRLATQRLRSRWQLTSILCISAVCCWIIELSQLIRAPALIAFRAAGARWILGESYSHADMVALLAGNLIAFALLGGISRRSSYSTMEQ